MRKVFKNPPKRRGWKCDRGSFAGRNNF